MLRLKTFYLNTEKILSKNLTRFVLTEYVHNNSTLASKGPHHPDRRTTHLFPKRAAVLSEALGFAGEFDDGFKNLDVSKEI